MALNIDGYDAHVLRAVKSFWNVRKTKGVRSGKTLDGFVELISWIVHASGLPNAVVYTSRLDAQLPGFFRPSKSWDIVVINDGKLVAAIELKSIADSFGKNSNNRNEEALGSGIDIKEAIAENVFEEHTRIFTGYLILVEDCPSTKANVKIQMRYFRAMKDFLAIPNSWDEVYVKSKKGKFADIDGVSYMKRFDILCTRLMQKGLYSAAAVITSPREAIADGTYGHVSNQTSIKAFLASLAAHVEATSAIENSGI